jgi:hypothetical protein
MTISEDLARIARDAIERHDEWDSLHSMRIICRTGEDKVSVRTYVAIDPSYPPEMYPVMIEALARKSADEGEPPYALLLQIEAYSATLSLEESAQRERGHGGPLKDRPDARECAWAWVTDVHGNLWSAQKIRGTDGEPDSEIEEVAYEAGSKSHDGRFIRAMTDSLRMYGSEYAIQGKASE